MSFLCHCEAFRPKQSQTFGDFRLLRFARSDKNVVFAVNAYKSYIPFSLPPQFACANKQRGRRTCLVFFFYIVINCFESVLPAIA